MAPPPTSPSRTVRTLLQHIRRDASPQIPQLEKHTQLTHIDLTRRQNDAGLSVLIPTTYAGLANAPPAGTVVGITLGIVLGIVFIILLTWWAMYQQSEGYVAESEIEVRSGPRRRHSRRYSETEIRRVSPRRSFSPRRRTEIVEERITSVPIIPLQTEVVREEIIEPRRRRERSRSRSEEEVVVYEESESTQPPPRRSSRRSQRDSGGYRTVEPDRFAGGDHPRRPVSRRYS
jgi:hypothetical protein